MPKILPFSLHSVDPTKVDLTKVDLNLGELRMSALTKGFAAGALLDFENSAYTDFEDLVSPLPLGGYWPEWTIPVLIIFCSILFASNILAFYMTLVIGLKVKKLDLSLTQIKKELGLRDSHNSTY